MTAFAGFPPEAGTFLRELARNNEKAWFEPRKADYERLVKTPLGDGVEALAAACKVAGLPFTGDRKHSVFRIHRDLRFSRDKRPYKTFASAVLSRDGTKARDGVLYVHFDPEAPFVAAGFHQPDPDALRLMRTAILERGEAFKNALAALKDAGLALDQTETLVRPPRGFTSDDPDLSAAFKLKSFDVMRPLPESVFYGPDLVAEAVRIGREALPLLDFFWTR